VGITYEVHPRLNIYGSYTQSSRVPTPVELTCADPEDPCRLPNAFVSDPPLQQVVAGTWEGGLRGETPSVDWTLAAFATGSADDILFVSSGTLRGEGHFENVSRMRRQGIEAGVEYELTRLLSTFAEYTWQRATFGTGVRLASRFHPLSEHGEIAVRAGNALPGVPRHTAKLGLTVAPTDRLDTAVTVHAQSGQFLRGDEANLLATLPGFALVHARARYRVTTRIAAVVQAQNILNAAFYTFGVLGDAEAVLGDGFDDPRFHSPGAPRAAWAGVELRF
jgi:outer membrane receptor protein involved in Fe transport